MIKKIVLLLLAALMLVMSGCSSRMFDWNSGNSSGIPGGNGKLYVAGWLRTIAIEGAQNSRKASFFKNIHWFNEINPVWYDVTYTNWDTNTYDPEVVSQAKGYGVKVVPTLGNVWRTDNGNGATIVNDLIGNESARIKHVQDIVKLVNDKGYDGIDINYENVGTTAINNANKEFTNFISLLGQELAKVNKSLSVCVYTPVVQWQKWPELLPYVNSLKVMVYDCDLTANPVPASICQLAALRRTLEYARGLGEVAKGKIIIGLPFYGRNWAKKKGDTTYSKSALLYCGVQTLMQNNSISPTQIMRSADGEPYFTYTKIEPDDKQVNTEFEHTVYFQDAMALRTR
ncbi:MAG TPA: glycosyl hydrolase family 18 protein, partial [Bacillota bacterium]|nr:glycosyl hydrolase family 18 protein [Bacillota bacterium]